MMLLTRKIPISILLLTSLLFLIPSLSIAAERPWLQINAPRFGVISQLTEKETLKWAEEFSQFLNALDKIYTINQAKLPPLTVVLFRKEKDFDPYRFSTSSGKTNISGFFSKREDWSIIGLYGRRGTPELRHTIYHEAVHWYMSAFSKDFPLWFDEGLAEVFSSFEIKKHKAKWGGMHKNSFAYLDRFGLDPIEKILRMEQDTALHDSNTFYPQAWLFLHYLFFSNEGQYTNQLASFLDAMETTGLSKAFEDSFKMSFEEMDKELKHYMRRGKYLTYSYEVEDSPNTLEVSKATENAIAFSLGRLAVAAGNAELAKKHAKELVDRMPERSEGYNLLGQAYFKNKEFERSQKALLEAVKYGSPESKVYFSLAEIERIKNEKKVKEPDQRLPAEVARKAVDFYAQAIRNNINIEKYYDYFVNALINTSTVNKEDREILEIGQQVFPTSGTIRAGFAVHDYISGEKLEAFEQFKISRKEPFRYSSNQRTSFQLLETRWFILWLDDELQTSIKNKNFSKLDSILVNYQKPEELLLIERQAIRRINKNVTELKILFSAEQALLEDKKEEAIEILENLVENTESSLMAKSSARQILKGLKKN